jgi:hypothetical protein
MKAANPWITYRTRFLVQAKQLTTSLTFTDALGRQHSGCKGDYLVESSNGSFGIAPRQIFEDIYVAMEAPFLPNSESRTPTDTASTQQASRPREILQRDRPLIADSLQPKSSNRVVLPHLNSNAPSSYGEGNSASPRSH